MARSNGIPLPIEGCVSHPTNIGNTAPMFLTGGASITVDAAVLVETGGNVAAGRSQDTPVGLEAEAAVASVVGTDGITTAPAGNCSLGN